MDDNIDNDEVENKTENISVYERVLHLSAQGIVHKPVEDLLIERKFAWVLTITKS